MTERDRPSFFGLKFLVGAAALFVVVAGLKEAQPLIVPFFFAVFLSILSIGPVSWLQRKSVPTSVAVVLVGVMLFLICFGVGTLLANSANEFAEGVPALKTSLGELVSKLDAYLEGAGYSTDSQTILSSLDPAGFMDILGTTLKGSFSAISKVLLVLILSIFMLVEAAEFRVKIRYAVGKVVDFSRFEEVLLDVRKYLGIKTVTSAGTGILVGLWVWFMNIDFPGLWGFVAFVLNYIPFIGSIVASVPALLLSLVKYGPGPTIPLGLGYLVINIGISNFIEPIFMGRRLGLSPLIVFLSLVFWGWLWGPAGALMSVPLTMIVKILLEHTEEFKGIAILMGSRPRKSARSER